MKRTFEITWPDERGRHWIDAADIRLVLPAAAAEKGISVKDVTPNVPPEPGSDINATVLCVGTCPSCGQFVVPGTTCDDCSARQKEARDIARDVVAETLEQMAKPFGKHMDEGIYHSAMDAERFAVEAKRLRAALEPAPKAAERTCDSPDCQKPAEFIISQEETGSEYGSCLNHVGQLIPGGRPAIVTALYD